MENLDELNLSYSKSAAGLFIKLILQQRMT